MQAIKNLFHLTRSFLAKHWLKIHPNVLIIAVTGSYGKTTTKEYLYQILSSKYTVAKTNENQNTDIGVSISILNNLKKYTLESLDVFNKQSGDFLFGL